MSLYAKAWTATCKARSVVRIAPVLAAAYLVAPGLAGALDPLLQELGLLLAPVQGLPFPRLLALAAILIIGLLSPTLLAAIIAVAGAAWPSLLGIGAGRGAMLALALVAGDGAAQRCLAVQPRAARAECRVAGCTVLGALFELLLIGLVVALALSLAGIPWWSWRLLVRLGDALPSDTGPAWKSFAGSPLVGMIVLAAVLGLEAWFLLVIGGWVRVILAGTGEDARRLLGRLARSALGRIRRGTEWYHETYRLATAMLIGAPLELGWAVVLGRRGASVRGLIVYFIMSTLIYLLVIRRAMRRIHLVQDLSIYKIAFAIMFLSFLPIMLYGLPGRGDILGEMLRAVRGEPPGPSPGAEVPLIEEIGRLLETALRFLFAG